MKKKFIYLIFLIIVGCDEDLPNQLTSVEGTVSDYYTFEPIDSIPLVFTNKNSECYYECEETLMDTVYSNQKGYYYEFFNDTNRTYLIKATITDKYYKNVVRKLNEGEKNVLDITLKPFRQLDLQFTNQTKKFNYIRVSSFIFENEEIELYPSDSISIATLKIIPETENGFYIALKHKTNLNEVNQFDTARYETLKFTSGVNDTTITYYY